MPDTKAAPALRFNGFADAWGLCKVGEIIEDYVEKTVVQNQYPVLTSSQQQGIVMQEDYFADRQVTTDDNIGYFVLPRGYFTYRSRSDTDVFVFNRNNLIDKGIISYYYPVFMPKGVDSDFLLRRLNYGMKRQLARAAEGTGQKVLAHNRFKEMEFLLPSASEQERIGELFEQLDSLITLHQRKYDLLVRAKKAMLEKMFPQNGAAVPEIRFAGFTDAWRQCKLGELFDFLQNNTLSRAELTSEGGSAWNIHYGDVLIKYGEYLDVSNVQLPFITSNVIINKFKGSMLQNGDIIMADTAEDETVGKCTEISGLQDFPTISGLHTIPMRAKSRFAPGYLGYYLNSSAYHEQLLPLMQGIKVTSVSKGAIRDTEIAFPQELSEQTAIGRYFIRLDHLITLHKRKNELFKQLKQSLLDKMFV